MQQAAKRKIAREVLIFFSLSALIGILWGILLIRNNYCISRQNKLHDQYGIVKSKIDSLSTDIIKLFYDEFSDDFVVNYKVNGVLYDIPKKDVRSFVSEFPLALIQQTDTMGYFINHRYYIIFQTLGKVYYSDDVELCHTIKKAYPEYSSISDKDLVQRIKNKYTAIKDSVIEINYIQLLEFRKRLKNKNYRNMFYSAFEKQNYPHQSLYELNIESGLKYSDNSSLELKKRLQVEENSVNLDFWNPYFNVFSHDEIKEILFYVIIILGAIIYPIRFCIFLIKWAIKTVKQ